MTAPTHRIAEIAYARSSYLLCYCGERIENDDPEVIAVAFQNHRAANGLDRRTLSSGSSNVGARKKLSLK